MINIKFPDGSVRTYEAGVTGYDVAMSISPRPPREPPSTCSVPSTRTWSSAC